jgi:hypothetical protein
VVFCHHPEPDLGSTATVWPRIETHLVFAICEGNCYRTPARARRCRSRPESGVRWVVPTRPHLYVAVETPGDAHCGDRLWRAFTLWTPKGSRRSLRVSAPRYDPSHPYDHRPGASACMRSGHAPGVAATGVQEQPVAVDLAAPVGVVDRSSPALPLMSDRGSLVASGGPAGVAGSWWERSRIEPDNSRPLGASLAHPRRDRWGHR